MNLLDFAIERSKVKVTARPTQGQINSLRDIFSSSLGMRGRILMKLVTVTHSHDTNYSFKVMSSKVKVTDNIFRKCTYLAEA